MKDACLIQLNTQTDGYLYHQPFLYEVWIPYDDVYEYTYKSMDDVASCETHSTTCHRK